MKITLGEKNIEQGIVQVWQQFSDGWSEPGILDGKSYRKAVNKINDNQGNYPTYLYFDVQSGFLQKTSSHCWVAVEYYDYADPSAQYFSVHYDSSSSPYEGRPQFRRDFSTGNPRWRWVLFYLPNPVFQGRQNGGADFRIDVFGKGNEILVHQVQLSLDPPDCVKPLIYSSDNPGESIFSAKTIQGYVNRRSLQMETDSPLVFMDLFPIDGIYNSKTISTDRIWLQEYLETHPDYAFCHLNSYEIINLFSNAFKHRVIYDVSQGWQRPIAATYASINSALLVASSEKNNIGSDLPILMDFSESLWNWPNSISPVNQTSISSKIEGYDWSIDNLLPLCTNEQILYLSENIPHPLDHLYANKVFCFDLDPLNDASQIARIHTILGKYPNMVPVYGWPDMKYATKPGQDNVTVENAGVQILTQEGKFLVASDLCSNLSFFNAAGSKSDSALYLQPPHRLLEYDPSKQYVVFLFSDGDNLQYDFNKMKALWSVDVSRSEKYSMDWTIAPSLPRMAPWAYEHLQVQLRASLPQSRFVAGPSGAGYVRPSLLVSSALTQFIPLTDQWNQFADLDGISSIDDTGNEDSVYRQFAQKKNIRSIFMVEPQHAGFSPGQAALLPGVTNGTQVPYVVENIRAQDQTPTQLAAEIQSKVRGGTRGNFVFVYCQAWNISPQTVAETIDQLGDSWEAVHMNELPFLFQEKVQPCRLEISRARSATNSLRFFAKQVFPTGKTGSAITAVDAYVSNNCGGTWFRRGTVNLGTESSISLSGLPDGEYLLHLRGTYSGYDIAVETKEPIPYQHYASGMLMLY